MTTSRPPRNRGLLERIHWTVDRLQDTHPSIPYNPSIANVFFLAGLIEAWGRGIHKINSECQAIDAPVPTLKYDKTGLSVEFTAREELRSSPEEVMLRTEGGSDQQSVNMSGKILSAIEQNSRITIPEMAATMEVADRTIARNFKKLQVENKLKRVGSSRWGYWEVRR